MDSEDYWGSSNISSNIFNDEINNVLYYEENKISSIKSFPEKLSEHTSQTLQQSLPKQSFFKNIKFNATGILSKPLASELNRISLGIKSKPSLETPKLVLPSKFDKKHILLIDEMIVSDHIRQNNIIDFKDKYFDSNKFYPQDLKIKKFEDSYMDLQNHKRILSNIPSKLYKAKDEKCHLLDCALFRNEFNTVLKVLLYCKNTLSTTNYLECLSTRPKALKIYMKYLSTIGEKDEAILILKTLGYQYHAFLLEYGQIVQKLKSDNLFSEASNVTNIEETITSLLKFQSVYNSYTETSALSYLVKLPSNLSTPSGTQIKFSTKLEQVQEFIDLLQTFYTMRKLLSLNQNKSTNHLCEPLFLTTFQLAVYAFKHYDPTNRDTVNLLNPQTIQQGYKINPTMMIYAFLISLCQNSRWADIETNFIGYPNRLNQIVNAKIQLEHFLISQILYIYSAPKEVLAKFVRRIEDVDDRKSLMD